MLGPESMFEIRELSLKAVFDIITLFGVDEFTDASGENTFMEAILNTLDHAQETELCAIVCEGFAKLFLLQSYENEDVRD